MYKQSRTLHFLSLFLCLSTTNGSVIHFETFLVYHKRGLEEEHHKHDLIVRDTATFEKRMLL